MNFWKRYPADYRKKTSRLTLAMHGAYTLLLDEVYITETALPAAIGELYRICTAMTKVERDAVDTVAARYFPVGSDGLRHNPRAAEELEEAAPAVAAARANGSKGGRPRKPSGNPVGFQNITQTKPRSKAPHSSDTPSLKTSFKEGEDRKRPSRFEASEISLPQWLDAEVWKRWCRDRKARGKPITKDGAAGQLKRLEVYRADGIHTPEAVLEHAIESGNQGLFPPPLPRRQPSGEQKSFRERDAEQAAADVARWGGGQVAIKPKRDVIEMEPTHGRLEHD